MRGLTKVALIENLGKNPDLQTLEVGVALAKFSLATTEVFKEGTDKAGEKRYVTEMIGESLLLLDKPEGLPSMPIYRNR
ncbi:MAG TPA: single-stranded DNA-binding protein [Saprospiraceae bacterium]|nr:single-stranded DNA-binding protein [Saprospiraceae bacterium]